MIPEFLNTSAWFSIPTPSAQAQREGEKAMRRAPIIMFNTSTAVEFSSFSCTASEGSIQLGTESNKLSQVLSLSANTTSCVRSCCERCHSQPGHPHSPFCEAGMRPPSIALRHLLLSGLSLSFLLVYSTYAYSSVCVYTVHVMNMPHTRMEFS
jgi:hypothetical protein